LETTLCEKGTIYSFEKEGNLYKGYLPLYGSFNCLNALAAIAACYECGVKISDAMKSLESFKNVEKHFEMKKGINNSVIIDDTWSTNPTSCENALKLLCEIAVGKEKVAVLGKMSLLGKSAQYYHRSIGNTVANLSIDKLIIVGLDATDIAIGALQKGMKQRNIYFANDEKEAALILKRLLSKETYALVKTSMLSKYKNIADLIRA
jgi:UDP-N-acetylmuramoyl-tripeptide--D-alanyl-D-alanine ligase